MILPSRKLVLHTPPRLAFGYEARQAVTFLKRTLGAQELEPAAR